MSSQVCYYHLVWATKDREPLITHEVEAVILSAITHKAVALDSPVLAINCMADHIHVAAHISPTLSVTDWVKYVKGISAHQVNTMITTLPGRFRWQEGYGVLTFGARSLPEVRRYIASQHEHHRDNTCIPDLERME